MKIIYMSCLISEEKLKKIWGDSQKYEGYQVQKFHRLFSDGFYLNGCEVTVLSVLPITRRNSKRLFFFGESEYKKNIRYIYPFIVNIPGLKHIFSLISILFHIRKLVEKEEAIFIIADCLNQTAALGGAISAKVLNIPSVGIVTDLPDFLTGRRNRINNFIMRLFDKYVLLSDQMNRYIKENITHKDKSYIVIEGMVDEKVSIDKQKMENYHNKSKKICMYAGIIDERYGVSNLVKSFIKADIPDAELHIYGNGEYAEKLKEICKKNKNVCYFGTRPNSFIVAEEQKVDLLINPRPSDEEFTKYSFPSKNMEYMVSGTPMLTTKLPGMPQEYLPYVYIFEDETVTGMAKKLKQVLSLPQKELYSKGKEARNYVLKNKSSRIQASKVLTWLSNEKIV